MHKIFDANDMAQEEGFANASERLRRLPERAGFMGKRMPHWNGKVTAGAPVRARVERGRWGADCECGGFEWVAPDVPFFCFSCGNVKTNGEGRPVIFPKEKEAIEEALMERKLRVMLIGSTPIAAMLAARPEIPRLGREWIPGETVADLRRQHTLGKALQAEMEKQAKLKERGKDGL